MMKNKHYKVSNKGFKNSDDIMKNGMLLPVHHGLTEKMFSKLHSKIEEFISYYS